MNDRFNPRDMRVSPRLGHLKPPRGGKDVLRSVPDAHLRSLAGQKIEFESTEYDDDGNEVRGIQQHHITPDDIHHELKWRNLI